MPIKIKANGAPVCTLSNEKLQEFRKKGGRSGHKARMELIRRDQLSGQGKDLFELVADADVTTVEA